MEHMFSAKEFDVNEYVYAIMDETGKNVLDNPSIVFPEPTFTTVTYILSDKNNSPTTLKKTLPTKDLFANASQYDNFKLAVKAEKKEK
jgi:hypothetical protein